MTNSSTLVFEVKESTTFEKVNKALEGVSTAASKLTNRVPLKKEQKEKSSESIINITTFEKVNKALEGVSTAASKLTNRVPLKKEQKENINAPIISTQQITINSVAPANNTSLKTEPLIELNIEGEVINNEKGVVDEKSSMFIDNSAMIVKYPILDMLSEVLHKSNLDVSFTETPNIQGYIMGEVFENGIPNTQLSFTVDLNGNFMSPDKKIFIPNAKSDSPIAIELLNIEQFTSIMSKKHINDDMSIFDLYTKEDKEINKLINLATLPEVVDSMNRGKVISILLKDGFQTSLLNAKKKDSQVYFVFSEYKSPHNFKLVSIDQDKPMNIVYNGKTAVLNTMF